MKVNNKVLIGGGIAALAGVAVIVGKKVYDKKKAQNLDESFEEGSSEEKETLGQKAVNFITEHGTEIAVATEVIGLVGAGLGAAETIISIKNIKKMEKAEEEMLHRIRNIDENTDIIACNSMAIATFSQASMPTAPRVAMEEYFVNENYDEDVYENVLRRINRGEIK